MPTTFLVSKLAATAVAAVAAIAAGATVWATSLAAAAPASLIQTDEFSAPATGRPLGIEYSIGPRAGRGMRQVPCIGALTSTTSCYVASP